MTKKTSYNKVTKIKVGNIYNNFEIINISSNSPKKYMCRCIKCGNTTEKFSGNIRKRGCGICSNQLIIEGINDCLTTNPELLKYVSDNKEDFVILSAGSNKKIKAKCPDCGYIKTVPLISLTKTGFSCNKCGDGISFPNKFIYNFLTQCNVEFSVEKIFKWSQNKRYDFYIPKYSLIIENHGKQHYSQYGFISLGGRTLEEEKENDCFKRELAIKNGINNYVELNCYSSDSNYIEKSIKQSIIFDLINVDMDKINWNDCYKYATKNIVKEVCLTFSSSNITAKDVGDIFGLTKNTIISYLKIGNNLGWCNYNSKDEMIKNGSRNGHKKSQRVICYEHSEIIFENALSCKKYLNEVLNIKADENLIRNTCRYKQEYHRKLHFLYFDKIHSCDIICVGIEEGSGRNKGTLGALVCSYKGNNVNVGSGFTDDMRREIWNNPSMVTNKIISVKYKEETTNKIGGVSIQFPVFECIRMDKDEESYN